MLIWIHSLSYKFYQMCLNNTYAHVQIGNFCFELYVYLQTTSTDVRINQQRVRMHVSTRNVYGCKYLPATCTDARFYQQRLQMHVSIPATSTDARFYQRRLRMHVPIPWKRISGRPPMWVPTITDAGAQ